MNTLTIGAPVTARADCDLAYRGVSGTVLEIDNDTATIECRKPTRRILRYQDRGRLKELYPGELYYTVTVPVDQLATNGQAQHLADDGSIP